jgi:hypothetical protein
MTVATPIFANPGQNVTIVIQTLDGYGTRADGYAAPQIDSILLPDLTASAGYPQAMTRIEAGLYRHTVTLPSGTAALGTFIVSASWPDPTTAVTQHAAITIQVALPFGNTTVIPA